MNTSHDIFKVCGLLLWTSVQAWVSFPQLLPPFPASTQEGPGPVCAQKPAQVKVREDLQGDSQHSGLVLHHCPNAGARGQRLCLPPSSLPSIQ